MPTNYDRLFNQAQGDELIDVLKGIKTAIGKNIGEVELTANGEYSADDLGYDSISKVTVNVSGGGGGIGKDRSIIVYGEDGEIKIKGEMKN